MAVTGKDTELPEQIAEIHRLLTEAYDHYFTYGDGSSKSGEGTVSVTWPTYFDMTQGRTSPSVTVYSYVFGPHRSNHYGTVEDALDAVRQWHTGELNETYGSTTDELRAGEPRTGVL